MNFWSWLWNPMIWGSKEKPRVATGFFIRNGGVNNSQAVKTRPQLPLPLKRSRVDESNLRKGGVNTEYQIKTRPPPPQPMKLVETEAQRDIRIADLFLETLHSMNASQTVLNAARQVVDNVAKTHSALSARVDSNSQPKPIHNDLPAVKDLLISDIAERAEFGKNKYGTYLQPNNGRDFLLDAYQEALDLVHYLRGLIYERDGK